MADREASFDRTSSELTVRQNAVTWALRTATVGEDVNLIVARAQSYENYVLGALLQSDK